MRLHARCAVGVSDRFVMLAFNIIYHCLVEASLTACHDFAASERLHVVTSVGKVVNSHDGVGPVSYTHLDVYKRQDTTIAATRTQGCKMNDKFKANLWIVLPAAVASLVLYIILGADVPEAEIGEVSNPWLVLPYLIIIATAIAGINVTVVLSVGILSAIVIAMFSGYDLLQLFGFMGSGIDSVGNLVIVTLLAAGMLGLIKAAGGIKYILQVLTTRINGSRGAMASIALLVSIVNLCTANNTVAILTVGSLSKEISTRFRIDPRKAASVLDTCSCIVQSLIPYGAQTLLATGLAGISPVAPWGYMYYSWSLIVAVALSIIFRYPRRLQVR